MPTVVPTTASPTADNAPLVAMSMALSSGSSSLYLDPSDSVFLSGVVTSAVFDCNATWSVIKNIFNADEVVMQNVPERLTAPLTNFRTVYSINSNVLQQRSAYTFMLSCLGVSAVVIVRTNGPPQPGRFEVSPALGGVEMQTDYLLNCSLWTDNDLPLRYEYYYVSTSASGTKIRNYVKSISPDWIGTSNLPSIGSFEAGNFTVTLTAHVYDAFDSFATATASTQVLPMPVLSASETESLISDRLSTSMSDSDEDSLKQVLAVASSIINRVDCSNLAPGYCSNMNRENCSAVSNSCGVCLPAFDIGEFGPSNSPCTSSVALSSVDIDLSSSTFPSCSSSVSCVNPFQECNITSGFCMYKVLMCANDCSGQGVCQYINKNTGNELATGGVCRQIDTTCSSVCNCDSGFNDRDCSVSDAELDSLQRTRESLVNGMANLMTVGTNGSSSFAGLSDNLASITQNPSQLSSNAVSQALEVASGIVAGAGGSGSLLRDSKDGVLASMNSILSAETSGQTVNNSINPKSVLSSVAAGLSGTSSLGSSSSLFENFRLSTVDSFSKANPNDETLTASVPVTTLETLSGVQPSSVSIVNDNGQPVNLVLMSSPVKRYSEALVANGVNNTSDGYSSNPMTVYVAATDGSAVPTVLEFTLQHLEPQPLGAVDDGFELPIINITCVWNQTSSHSVTCPNGAVVEQACDGVVHGVLFTQCPQAIIVSDCYLLDSDGLPSSEGCEVLSQTAASTTCRCQLFSSSTGRKLAGDEDAGASEVAAMSVSTFEGFVDTFAAADDLTSAAAFEQVLAVIIMFGIMWVGGFVGIGLISWAEIARGSTANSKAKQAEAFVQDSPLTNEFQMDAARRYLLDYVEKTFPPVFILDGAASGSRFWRCYREIKNHHRYITLVSSSGSSVHSHSRSLLLFQLLTIQTMLMFMLALCFDLQGPMDDGSCEQIREQASCLHRKSDYDTSASYCKWVDAPDPTAPPNMGSCLYADPTFTWQMFVLSSLVVALFTALFNVPIDWAFDLLFSPTADALKVQKDQQAMLQTAGRRMSNVAASVAKTARRASAVVTGAAAAAGGAAMRQKRDTQAGEITRQIPEGTKSAHILARKSLKTAEPLFQSVRLKRQQSRSSVYNKVGVSAANISKLPLAHQAKVRFQELCTDIVLQRQMLMHRDLKIFDTQWSLHADENGELCHFAGHAAGSDSGTERGSGKHARVLSSVEQCVLKEVEATKMQARESLKKLEYATDAHIGLEILHSFILDILGRDTPAAKIFAAKTHEDFSFTMVVTLTFKTFLVFALICLNIFFVYFALLRSYQRGVSFQRSYVAACIAQFFIEILVFQAMECILLHFVVPNLIADQVTEVARTMKQSLDVLFTTEAAGQYSEGRGGKVSRYQLLDVTQYLFVSSAIAQTHPSLLESHIVSAYHTYLPGELAKKWHKHNIHEPTSYYYETLVKYRATADERSSGAATVLKFMVFNMLYSTALFFGAFPVQLQRVFLELLQPVVFAGVVAFWFVVADSVPATIVLSLVTVLLVASGAYYGYNFASQSATVDASNATKGRLGVVIPMDSSANPDEFIDLQLDLDGEDESSADSSSGSVASESGARASLYSVDKNPNDPGVDYSLSSSDAADSEHPAIDYSISSDSGDSIGDIVLSEESASGDSKPNNPYDNSGVVYEISSESQSESDDDEDMNNVNYDVSSDSDSSIDIAGSVGDDAHSPIANENSISELVLSNGSVAPVNPVGSLLSSDSGGGGGTMD